jgi:hypothetical protein
LLLLCRLRWATGSKTKNPIIDDGFVAISALHIQPTSSGSTETVKAATDSAATTAADTAADANAAAVAEGEPAAKRQRTAGDGSSAAHAATAAAAAATAGWLGPGMSAVAPDVVCYMCQLGSIPGKFNPKKAAELGVPRGPVRLLLLCYNT